MNNGFRSFISLLIHSSSTQNNNITAETKSNISAIILAQFVPKKSLSPSKRHAHKHKLKHGRVYALIANKYWIRDRTGWTTSNQFNMYGAIYIIFFSVRYIVFGPGAAAGRPCDMFIIMYTCIYSYVYNVYVYVLIYCGYAVRVCELGDAVVVVAAIIIVRAHTGFLCHWLFGTGEKENGRTNNRHWMSSFSPINEWESVFLWWWEQGIGVLHALVKANIQNHICLSLKRFEIRKYSGSNELQVRFDLVSWILCELIGIDTFLFSPVFMDSCQKCHSYPWNLWIISIAISYKRYRSVVIGAIFRCLKVRLLCEVWNTTHCKTKQNKTKTTIKKLQMSWPHDYKNISKLNPHYEIHI